MANEVNLVNGVGGVGRDVRALPLGTITVTPTSRNAALNNVGCPTPPGPPCVLGSQPLVANGLAFDRRGRSLQYRYRSGSALENRIRSGWKPQKSDRVRYHLYR